MVKEKNGVRGKLEEAKGMGYSDTGRDWRTLYVRGWGANGRLKHCSDKTLGEEGPRLKSMGRRYV